MPSISQMMNYVPDFQQLFQNPTFTASTHQLQARSQTLTNTNFSLVTAEGDRVSLSTGSEINTSLGTYTFEGLAEGQAVNFQRQQFSTSIQQNFHLFIEGDLNEQEQADIQEFLKSAKRILQELAEGHAEEATKTAASLGNLDSISQAALFVRQATSISVATQSTNVAVQEEPGLKDASRGSSQSELRRLSTLDQIFEKIRDAQEKFQIDSEKLVNRLPSLTTALIQSLETDSESSDSVPSILTQIQKAFLESLLESTKNIKAQQETEGTLPNRFTPTNPALPVDNADLSSRSFPQRETTQN